MNQIPEEIRNILFPEFLMKELSNLENCKEGCQSCCKAQNDGGRLSDLCLHLQFSRVQAKISRTVPEVFAFIKMQQLAHSQWTPKRRTMSDAIHEAFPSLTLPQCVQLVHAWAVYDAKYENPVDKDGLAIRFRYYIEYQTQRGPVSAHVAEYWDRDTLEWKRQGVYFFSNTYREIDSGENLEERSRFLSFLLDHIRSGYQVEYIPGVFTNAQLAEDE